MKVGDIMTRQVVSIPPQTPVLAVARLLAERGLADVAVTDSAQTLLGVVSEDALVHRLAVSDPEASPGGVIGLLFYDRDRAAERYADAHGATAAEIMATNVVTATETMTAEHAAHLLETYGLRRLPVVQDATLVGAISRADLLRALVTPPTDTSDAAIRAAVLAEMRRLPWADAPFVFLEVHDGVVALHGFCHSHAVHRGLAALARDTPGVRGVEDRIVETTGHRWA